MNEQKNQAVWEMFKARLKERWKNLTDDLIDAHKNDFNTLIAHIQSVSEESREVIQDYVDSLWFEIYVRPSRSSYSKNPLNGRG